MTPGTSPHPQGIASTGWTAAERTIASARARLGPWWAFWIIGTTAATPARTAALLYLAALVIFLMTASHPAAAGGMLSQVPAWHLALLVATGAGVAVLTLARSDAGGGHVRDSEELPAPTAGLGELMAQLSHELRTPLNAVIGFSELMVRELHGPLGNARYQQYAQHISESGGRLLRSSEEALSVTEAMTALMADRRGAKRERRIAAALVRDAWRAASADAAPPLVLNTCTTCDVMCERRPTVQALEHLLREAAGYAGENGTIAVTGRRRARQRSLEIRATGAERPCSAAANRGLRVILARLLLEMQGATLTLTSNDTAWTALIEFPGRV
jgi:signal transduction histidine kinase